MSLVSVSLPGLSDVSGLWPAGECVETHAEVLLMCSSLLHIVWTMGNLGRAGYGATTDGTWPYSVMFSFHLIGSIILLSFSMIHVIGEHFLIKLS